MDDIAARAGVSVGTLYNYFSDRTALLAALIDSRRKNLLSQFDCVLEEYAREPFETQLEATLRTLLEHFEAHQRFLSILMEGEHARDVQAMPATKRPRETMRALYSRFETLAQRGLSLGSLQPEYSTLYPAILMGMLRGLLVRTLYEERQPGSIVERAPQLVDTFLNGAGRKPRVGQSAGRTHAPGTVRRRDGVHEVDASRRVRRPWRPKRRAPRRAIRLAPPLLRRRAP